MPPSFSGAAKSSASGVTGLNNTQRKCAVMVFVVMSGPNRCSFSIDRRQMKHDFLAFCFGGILQNNIFSEIDQQKSKEMCDVKSKCAVKKLKMCDVECRM